MSKSSVNGFGSRLMVVAGATLLGDDTVTGDDVLTSYDMVTGNDKVKIDVAGIGEDTVTSHNIMM